MFLNGKLKMKAIKPDEKIYPKRQRFISAEEASPGKVIHNYINKDNNGPAREERKARVERALKHTNSLEEAMDLISELFPLDEEPDNNKPDMRRVTLYRCRTCGRNSMSQGNECGYCKTRGNIYSYGAILETTMFQFASDTTVCLDCNYKFNNNEAEILRVSGGTATVRCPSCEHLKVTDIR